MRPDWVALDPRLQNLYNKKGKAKKEEEIEPPMEENDWTWPPELNADLPNKFQRPE